MADWRGRRQWFLGLLLLAAAPWVAAAFYWSPTASSYSQMPEYRAAQLRLQQAHRAVLGRDSPYVRDLLRLPIQGDSGRLRAATAALLVIHVQYQEEARLLEAHQSRLLAEDFLGRPRTRVATVADAIELERSSAQSNAGLMHEVFRRAVQVELPQQALEPMFPGGSAPKVEVLVRHAALPAGDLAGEFEVRLALAEPGARTWHRGCYVPEGDSPGWQRHADGSRSGRFGCNAIMHGERPEDVRRAFEALRTGEARLAVVPRRLQLLPARYEENLPFAQAAEQVLSGNCASTGTCGADVHAWLRKQPPGLLVLAFAAVQLALCAWLLRRPAAPGAAAVAGWPTWLGLAYLAVVVLAHAGAIAFAISPQGGGLVLLLAWGALGLPLFGPGLLAGVLAIAAGLRGAPLRQGKIVLGVLALTLPALEWVLLSVLKSGYGGG